MERIWKEWTEHRQDWAARLCTHRRWLHRHPELSLEERETARYLAAHLEAADIPCRMVEDCGVIAGLTAGDGLPTVAIRAEIDALPIEEQTGLPFASACPGKMHACGHDANAAVLLTLAEFLAPLRSDLPCNLRFLFEPGEECGEGANLMIRHGALLDPRPDCLLVFHFGNQEARSMEIQQNVSTARTAGLEILVRGRSTHFSQYDDGIDAMYAAARLVEAVHDLHRSLRTAHPFRLGLGMLEAGVKGNIVAEHARLKGSIRAFTNEDFTLVYEALTAIVSQTETETGANIEWTLTRNIPPICNDPALVARGREAGIQVFGDRFQLGTKPFLVGDNAAYYLEQVPGMRVVFLAGKPDEPAYPVHHPRFDLDEDVLADALEFFLAFLLQPGSTG